MSEADERRGMKEVHIYLYSTIKGCRVCNGAYTYILETATSRGDATISRTEIVENVTAHKSLLLALMAALRRIRQTSYLVIYTDSNYVASNVRKSLARWKKNGWKTARGEVVKHQEEWQEIAQLLLRHSFEVVVSSGHSYYQWMKTESEKAAECI